MKNNSVCVVSDSFYPIVNASSLRNHYLLIELKKHYTNLTFLTAVNNPLAMDGVHIISMGILKSDKGKFIIKRFVREFSFAIAALIHCVIHKFRIYYISSPSYLLLLFVCPILSILGRNYIIEIRDLYPQALADKGFIGKKSLIYILINLLTEKIYKNALGITTVTKTLFKYLSKRNHNCLLAFNCSPIMDVNFINKRSNDKFTVIMHGNFGRFQSIDVLIKLVKITQNKDVNFIFIGYGYYFEKLIMYLSEFNHVAIFGVMSRSILFQKLSTADLGLSLRDNSELSKASFPVRLWEYIGIGLPVVSAGIDNDGSRFVEEYGVGLVAECSANEILKKILYCKKNPLYMASCRKKMFKLREIFNRETESRKVVNFINESLKCVD